MKLAIGTISALIVLVPVCAAFSAPRGGISGGIGAGAMAGPAPVSATGANPPTNPNTRSGNALGHPGSPAVSCQAIGVSPGNAANSPGAPFNEPSANSLGGNAGLHYAGNAPQNSKNTASVAQYDVACANQLK